MDINEKHTKSAGGLAVMLIYLQMIETRADKDKFEYLYKAYRNLMFVVAEEILHNQEDAEDAVHQAFVSILEHLEKISDPVDARARSFCVTCSKYRALDIYRKKQHILDVEFEQLQIEVETDFPDGTLEAAIMRLSPALRDVLLLKYDNGFSIEEIAKIMGIDLFAARKRLTRAKAKLKELLEKEGVEV